MIVGFAAVRRRAQQQAIRAIGRRPTAESS